MEHEFERQLRTLAIERRPEACLGCGFEHGCSVHGCAVIHAAVNRLAAYEETGLEPEDMKKAFNEDTTLKLAGQILGMSPDRLRELAQADREGRLRIVGVPKGACCGTCRHFEREAGTVHGACRIFMNLNG